MEPLFHGQSALTTDALTSAGLPWDAVACKGMDNQLLRGAYTCDAKFSAREIGGRLESSRNQAHVAGNCMRPHEPSLQEARHDARHRASCAPIARYCPSVNRSVRRTSTMSRTLIGAVGEGIGASLGQRWLVVRCSLLVRNRS